MRPLLPFSGAGPLSETQRWLASQAVIRERGADNAVQAAMKAHALIFEGGQEGAGISRMIVRRVYDLGAWPTGMLH